MSLRGNTGDRILKAFMELVIERGLEATTTRAIAERAGVNEVTLFRQFKDKASLMKAAFEHFSPAKRITEYQPKLDLSTPESSARSLVDYLLFLLEIIQTNSALIQFGLGEYWRFPELQAEFTEAPFAARAQLEKVLTEMQSVLRPEVSLEASVLSLQGLLFLVSGWQQRGWLNYSKEDWPRLFNEAVRPLINWNK